MIDASYLSMVRIFLQQELTQPYNQFIEIEDDKIVVALPNDDNLVNATFDEAFYLITQQVQRIRQRNYDLSFTVRTTKHVKEFKVSV